MSYGRSAHDAQVRTHHELTAGSKPVMAESQRFVSPCANGDDKRHIPPSTFCSMVAPSNAQSWMSRFHSTGVMPAAFTRDRTSLFNSPYGGRKCWTVSPPAVHDKR